MKNVECRGSKGVLSPCIVGKTLAELKDYTTKDGESDPMIDYGGGYNGT